VLAGLPAAQAQQGAETAVLVPLYRGVAERVRAAGHTLSKGVPLALTVGASAYPSTLRSTKIGAVTYGFVDCAPLYDRAGGLYGPGGASEWFDNHVRFAVLGKAALAAGPHLVGATPDVLHVHDWQGGAAAIYARLDGTTSAIVTTIHNLAYRGIFPKSVMDELGLPWSAFTPKLLEFWDQVSFLKGALAMSDAVTTVSPTYAREILTPTFGEGLDGFLTYDVKRLVGIANGIDEAAYDPATDAALPARYSAGALDGKTVCRAALAKEVGLQLGDGEVMIGVIARMTGQKGLDLVADIVPELYRLGARLVVLGAGEPELEARFRYLGEMFANHVAVRIGFDIGFARRIYGGCDLFLMPSRFEPCGLGQLYAMRYGTIPVVHSVGGLHDTVHDVGNAELARGRGTGFAFVGATPRALLGALERAVALHRDRAGFTALRRAAMARDSSWTTSAAAYLGLYRELRT
jgi:starch synthase